MMLFESETPLRQVIGILLIMTIPISALCLCAILCGKQNGWEGYRFLADHKNELDVACLATGIVGLLGLSFCPFSSNQNVLYFVLGAMIAAAAIGSYVSLYATLEDHARDAYDISRISCVYVDHGDAAEALVEYHPEDKDPDDIKLRVSASDLGYDDVVLDDSITKPEEELTPAGAVLAVPESYLRKN